MYYDRQIKYFDYKKDGVRLRGAGFLKIEIRGENCNLSLQISGLQSAENSMVQVYGLWEKREEVLGNIFLQDGRGSKELYFMRSGADSLVYEGLLAIRIPLREGTELYCRVGNQDEAAEKTREELHVDEVTVAEMLVTNVSEIQQEDAQSVEAPEEEVRTEAAPVPEPRRMLEEKWEQLWGVYPHLRPFQDEREYLQIGPEDFLLLRERFYKLVHNSFLLHGFYNYQHLILTRLERRGEKFYYIGVPGNFYDREKQVAVMYGFESFECAKEPAGQGDFGYYMIRVEL